MRANNEGVGARGHDEAEAKRKRNNQRDLPGCGFHEGPPDKPKVVQQLFFDSGETIREGQLSDVAIDVLFSACA